MFEAVLKTPPVAPKIDPEIALLVAMEHFTPDLSSLVAAESLLSTIDDLSALRANFSKFGITQAVVDFANHNGMLTAAIPAVPSVESMRGDIDITGATPALEGIAQTIKETAARWLAAIKEHVIKYKKWYAVLMAFLLGAEIGFVSLLIGSVAAIVSIPAALALFGAQMVFCYASGYLLGRLVIAKSMPLAVKMALDVKLPGEGGDVDAYKKKIGGIFKERAGYDIETGKGIGVGDGEKEKKTTKELGYDAATSKKVANETKMTVDELKKLGTTVESKMNALANSAEAQSEEGRSALTWLAGVISKAMKYAGDAATDGTAAAKQLNGAAKKAKAEADKNGKK